MSSGAKDWPKLFGLLAHEFHQDIDLFYDHPDEVVDFIFSSAAKQDLEEFLEATNCATFRHNIEEKWILAGAQLYLGSTKQYEMLLDFCRKIAISNLR